jgi:hypothetical protein
MPALLKEAATVQVVMTDAAQQFITPLTLQALSNRSVHPKNGGYLKEFARQLSTGVGWRGFSTLILWVNLKSARNWLLRRPAKRLWRCKAWAAGVL